MRLGSDPELFLKDQNGKIVSAIGKIGGTKDAPIPVKGLPKGFFVQEDNVLLEYNTPVANSQNRWVDYHNQILKFMGEKLQKENGLLLADISSHSMDEDQMNSPRAWIFGCDPDFNVWDLDWNKKPRAKDRLLRSAGGHIHVEFEGSNTDKIRLGRFLDFYLGTRLGQVDKDKRRRELYGKAGAIRFKEYGIEYRTPSNYWVMCEQNIAAVWDCVQTAVKAVTGKKRPPDEIINMARTIIDEDDTGLYNDLVDGGYLAGNPLK